MSSNGRRPNVYDESPAARAVAGTQPSRIALLVDNPARDLLGLVLVARELALRGHTAYLVPMNLKEPSVSALAPDFLLLNYLKRANERFARAVMDAGIAVGVMDTEGGAGIVGHYGEIEDHYGNVMAQDERTRQQAVLLCTWGPRIADHFIRRAWYRPDQVVVTGCPRFDLYAEPWRRMALTVSAVSEVPRPMVLVLGSFPLANPRLRTVDEEVATRVVTTGYSRDVVERQRRRDLEALEGMVALVERLAREFPAASFVYRPHPFEGDGVYRERLGHLANVNVIRNGTLDAWMLEATAVVQQNDCTAALDAAMADVPTLIPAWSVPEQAVESVMEAGLPYEGPDDLISALGQILAGQRLGGWDEHSVRKAEATSQWLHAADGKAHCRVADAVEARLRRAEPDRRRLRRLHYRVDDPGRAGRDRAQDLLKMRAGLPYRWSFRHLRIERELRWDSSPKAFRLAEIERLLAAATEVSGVDSVAPRSATRGVDYDFRYEGRAVAVEPRP